MANIESIDKFLSDLRAIFIERHKQYGSAGMSIEKAASLASTKIDRIMNGGATEDSALDLAGYGMIMWLISKDLWGRPFDGDGKVGLSSNEVLMMRRDPLARAYPMPVPKKAGDVGFDLYTTEATIIPASSQVPVNVPTGIAVKIPDGYWAEIKPRSSTNKRGITVVASVVDSGYTGPIFALAHNTTDKEITVNPGERIAQMIIHDAHVPPLVEVDFLPETERGATGFGSTGA